MIEETKFYDNRNNIIIIVPHEDDEVLMTAGIIEHAVREKKNIKVVMVTNGDYEGTDTISGSVRLSETIAGLKSLGLSEEDVIFLGYADTGMDEGASFIHGLYLETDENQVHPGHCSDMTYALPEKPDYHTKRYGSPALYNRKNFKADLKEIIAEEKPDCIFTTSKEDLHGDHSGLFYFVLEILKEQKKDSEIAPELYSGLVHSAAGDDVWPKRSKEIVPLNCPKGFELGSLDWKKRISFPVPEDMKVSDLRKNRKAQALAQHKNALKEDAVEFLYTFLKADEVFWKIEY